MIINEFDEIDKKVITDRFLIRKFNENDMKEPCETVEKSDVEQS